MKKSMYPLVFGTVLLTSCGNTEMSKAAIPADKTETVSVTETGHTTAVITSVVPEKLQETMISTTVVTSVKSFETTCVSKTDAVCPGGQESNIALQEIQEDLPDTVRNPMVTTELVQTAVAAKSTTFTQATELTTTTAIVSELSEEEKLVEIDSNLSYDGTDYDRALAVYEYMTANGSGTCVQYAYQTYEMCRKYGVECYFTWTENKLYGHVANAVKVDGMWFVLDTQAGCFLTENLCGFTEIVDENENFISDASIISETRYDQL